MSSLAQNNSLSVPTAPSGANPSARAYRLAPDLLILFVVSTAISLTLVAVIDNTNLNTTNGLWKSLEVRRWAENAPDKRVLDANVLLFPVNGFLVRMMPEFCGPIFRRMAILNCFYGGLGIISVFALLRGLNLSRGAAYCAAIFQAGCAFYLISAITSEDIMPAVAFLTLACAVVAWTWDRLTWWSIFWAAQPFSMAWMFEWRLLLPSLPGFMAALYLAPGTLAQRLKRGAQFIAALMMLPILCGFLVKVGHLSHHSWPTVVRNFILVDKGLGSGWGGWAWNKVALLVIGIEEYLFHGENIANIGYCNSYERLTALTIAWGLVLGLIGVGLRFAYLRWQEINWRSTCIVLIGIFGCAEVFNLYSQPQDPQMQMNAMLWLAVAWGIGVSTVLARAQSRQKLALTACLALSACPLVINIGFQLPKRGLDSINEGGVKILLREIPPDHTVIAFHGFEGLTTWIAALQGWDHYMEPTLKPSDSPWKTWKVLSMVNEAATYPTRPAIESAQRTQAQINSALDQNVRVIINNSWDKSEDAFCDLWATIGGPEKPRELYRMLKREYDAVLVLPGNPNVETSPFYELRRKNTNVAQDPRAVRDTQ